MARALALSITLPPDLRKQLDDAAVEDRVSRGEVIRRALEVEFARRNWVKTRPAAKRNDDAA